MQMGRALTANGVIPVRNRIGLALRPNFICCKVTEVPRKPRMPVLWYQATGEDPDSIRSRAGMSMLIGAVVWWEACLVADPRDASSITTTLG